MSDNTNNTPSPEDNLLGLINYEEINIAEATGIAKAEFYILELDSELELSASLLLEIHLKAFEKLYSWAGKWRTTVVTVGQHIPPEPSRIPNLIYQLIDHIKFSLQNIKNKQDLIELLAYTHHRLVYIHPFTNGNGRTARLFTNYLTLINGYNPIQLYHREGTDREIYINAIKQADKGNLEPLQELIERELMPF